MDLGHKAQEGLLPRGADAPLEQIVDQHADGVDRALGHGGVAADAGGREVPESVRRSLRRDAPGALQFLRPDPGLGLVGDGVGRKTAAEVHDVFTALRRDGAAVVDAFLAVAQREVGIGAEAEERRGIVFEIPGDVLHADLLVYAEQRADGIAQRNVMLLEIFQRIEAQHARPLVVEHAAADDPALALTHGKGVGRPAFAHRDDVEMGDRGEIVAAVASALAELGITDHALAVFRLQPHAARDLQRGVERPGRALAEGLAWQGGHVFAVDGDKFCDIGKDRLFIFRGKAVDLSAQFFVHFQSPSL